MSDFAKYIDMRCAPSVRMRQDVERRIADEIVKALFGKGYVVRVHDGEEFCTRRTSDPDEVQKAIQSTDEDEIVVYRVGEKEPMGVIALVYGNEGYDVVSDWTSVPELNEVIEPILEKHCG